MIDIKNFTLTILALEELKEMGYKEVWIGQCKCPHWPWMGMGDIVAIPKNGRAGWPALWSGSDQVFGERGSGNGLKNADQVQRRGLNLISGYYKLIDKKWQTNVFKENNNG